MTKPVRLQLSRRKGFELQAASRALNGLECVKVDRSTGLGNPFPIHKGTSTNSNGTKDVWVVGTWTGPALWICDSREEAVQRAVDAYRAWITHPSQERLLAKARLALAGKNAACWCGLGRPCHADVLLELANTTSQQAAE